MPRKRAAGHLTAFRWIHIALHIEDAVVDHVFDDPVGNLDVDLRAVAIRVADVQMDDGVRTVERDGHLDDFGKPYVCGIDLDAHPIDFIAVGVGNEWWPVSRILMRISSRMSSLNLTNDNCG